MSTPVERAEAISPSDLLRTTAHTRGRNRGGRKAGDHARLLENRSKGSFYGKRPDGKGGTERKEFGTDRAEAVRRYDLWKKHEEDPNAVAIAPLFEPRAIAGHPRRARALRLAWFWHGKTAADIDAASCRAYHEWFKGFLEDGTIRGDLKALHAVVGEACAAIDETYVIDVVLPGEGRPREAFFFAEGVTRLLHAAAGQRRDPEAADGWLRDEYGKLVLTDDEGRLFAGRMLTRFVELALYTASRRGVVENGRWRRGKDHGHFDRADGIFYRKGRGERRNKKRASPVKLTPRLYGLLEGWRLLDLADWQRDLPTRRAQVLGRRFTDALASALDLAPDEEIVVETDEDLAVDCDIELGLDFELERVVHDAKGDLFQIGYWWDVFRAEAGLDDDLVPHSLRKTMAIWLAAAGVDDERIADFLDVSLPILAHHYLIADVALTDPIADALDAWVMRRSIEQSVANTAGNAWNRHLHELVDIQPREGKRDA